MFRYRESVGSQRILHALQCCPAIPFSVSHYRQSNKALKPFHASKGFESWSKVVDTPKRANLDVSKT